jgi:hypothetical protein
MARWIAFAAALSLGFALSPGQAQALGCMPVGTEIGPLGPTVSKLPKTGATGDCAIGHYAALQQKRNSSATFAQPKNATATPNQ